MMKDETIGNIKTIPTGHVLERWFATMIGLGGVYKKYIVPDIVDHTIERSNGVNVHLEGPRENLTVTCETPDGDFPLNVCAPDDTTFAIDAFRWKTGYSVASDEKRILIPANDKRKELAVFGILHEGGHLWNKQDKIWDSQYTEAKKRLSEGLLYRALFSEAPSLPKDPAQRTQELAAWKIILEEEQRASANAIYIVGCLRNRLGIDLVPEYSKPEDFQKVGNFLLKTHDQFKFGVRFETEEIAALLDEKHQPTSLQQKIVSHIGQALGN